jgi:protein phosphatase
MTTQVRAAGQTDVGRARERNEDAWFSGTNVFAVADGLGGHRAGEVASELALESIRALDEQEPKKAANHVADAVRRGNRAVHTRAADDPELKGMGTTLTAIAVHDGVAHLAHVGDSRCYLLRGGSITQLSRDHTLVARMVAEGRLTPEQAEAHPQRSVLTRALGAERDVDVQTQNIVLQTGDRLLLCSDGLSGVLTDDDMLRFAGRGEDLQAICDELIDEANARGGPDNITAVLVEVVSAPAGPAKRRDGAPAVRERRFPVRAAAWMGIAAAVALVGLFALRQWATNSYYVGEKDGKVTIFRGVPGVPLANVEEPTDIEVAKIDSPSIRRSLENGIRASSLQDAWRIIEQQIEPNVEVEEPRAPLPKAKRS